MGTTALTCSVVDASKATASCASIVVVTSDVPKLPTPLPLAIQCPVPSSVVAPNGKQVKVDFAAVVTGGTAPISTSCSPSTADFFAVGTTAVLCKAVDARQVTQSCTTSITVTAAAATTPSPVSGSPVTIDGVVSAPIGSCPVLSFTVDNRTIVTNTSTDYAKGSCQSLSSGKTVHIVGVAQSTSVVATTITFSK